MTGSNTKPGLFYGYIIVGIGFTVLTITWMQNSMFGLFMAPVLKEFQWSRAVTSSAYSVSFIFYGLFSIVVGRLTDHFGPRLVVTVCGILLGAGLIMMWQISALWQYYVAFILIVGIGSGASFVPIASTVSRWFFKRRSIMNGIALAGIGASSAIFSPVSSWLILVYGWRMAYLVLGIFSLVGVVTLAQFMKRDPSKMGLRAFGETALKSEVKPIHVDRGASFNEALHTPQFWMLCFMFFGFGVSIIGILIHIVVYATDAGIPISQASSILSVYGVAMIGGRIALGLFADRVNNRKALLLSAASLTISLVWLLLVAKELWMLYVFIFFFGIACGGSGSLVSSVVAELFGTKAHGTILGVINFGWTLGGALGPWMSGYIFDVQRSYFLAVAICAVLSLAVLILSMLVKPIVKQYA